jgi:DNA repair exonuclease SbcCD ATPase subunit
MADELDKYNEAAGKLASMIGNMLPRIESVVSAVHKETAEDAGSSSSGKDPKRGAIVVDTQKIARMKKLQEDLKNQLGGLQTKQHELESLIKLVQSYNLQSGVKGAIQKVNPLAGRKKAALLKTLEGVLEDLKKGIKNAQDLHIEKYKGYA